MQNLWLYSIFTCLQVLYFFRYINCASQFRCKETPRSIIENKTCTLENYMIFETSEFQLDRSIIDPYSSWGYGEVVFELRFINGNISYIPHGIFTKLPNVHTLHVSFCNLLELSRYDFKSANNLKVTNLANNNLTRLPDSAFNEAKRLIDINLAHNKINHINRNAFKSLSKVTHINLSYNQIVVIPDYLFANSIAFVDLDLSQNLINVFGSWFNKTDQVSIDRLNLNYNRITNITLKSNVAIKELMANNNELAVINLVRGGAEILWVDNNKLQYVGLLFSECNLIELSIKNNSLLDFNFVRNMTNLNYLDLSFNIGAGQSLVSDTFEKLTNLISLRMEAVNLRQLDFHLFSYLLRLKVLDISYNGLNSINFHMLSFLENLQQLSINGNNLTNLTLTEFEFLFPNLKTIDISDNNWLCDDLVNILRKLKELNVQTRIGSERLNRNETIYSIRGIRCYHNSSEWSSVKKIPLVDMRYSNNETKPTVAELNLTKSNMDELKVADFLKIFEGDRNRTEFTLNQLTVQIQTLQNQHNIENRLAEDIKFIKTLLVIFLMAGICVVGLKCYRMYVKRPPYWIAKFYPSTNTITTNITEENNC